MTGRWLEALLFRWPQADAPPTQQLHCIKGELDGAGVALRVFAAPPGCGLDGQRSASPAAVAEELTRLAAEGIGPGLIGAVGELAGLPPQVVRAPAGLGSLEALADAQLRMRRDRRVPTVELDPAWTLELAGDDPMLVRVEEALCTLADTQFGTRGSLEEGGPGADPLVVAAGRYTDGHGEGPEATPTLLPGPLWTQLEATPPPACGPRRLLDLSCGVLVREGALRAIRFACLADPGRSVLRAEGPSGMLAPGRGLVAPDDAGHEQAADVAGAAVMRSTSQRGWIVAAARDEVRTVGSTTTVERSVALGHGRKGDPRVAERRLIDRLDGASFEELLRQQRRAWTNRWERAAVAIEGDEQLELAVRFALFHLIASVADRGEAAVGARGLSGRAYRGHVFWDADVFVLPFLAATHAPAARAMLSYRHERLGQARRRAAERGCEGARFPWESADDGTDVTPEHAIGVDGEIVQILTGRYQEHVTADVAWAAGHYLDWTGDRDFADGPACALLVETARYWRSRARYDDARAAHLYEVIGPDEYHGPVDDNAFTNGMACWNLRRAAALVGPDDPRGLRREAAAWRQLADDLVDGFDPATGRHEQFAGYDRLEPLLIGEIAEPPVAADVLLGRERTAGTQVIKQADVLMLHHLLPDVPPPGSLQRDLDHYLPRTAHGSSLSPGIHACLLARAGRADDALEFFRLAARLDLDDSTGTTAGGLHLATFGSVWQALTYGFVGLRPQNGWLDIDPHLPAGWEAVEVRVGFAGVPLRICAGHERVTVQGDQPVTIRLGGRRHRTRPPLTAFATTSTGWRREAGS